MKIKDRLLLGAIAGLGGTIAKNLLLEVAQAKKWAEFDGAETSAGILLPGHKIATPKGKIAGHLANCVVGTTLGVATTYMFSMTGKDNAVTKGGLFGQVSWLGLHGLMANLGASSVRPTMPRTMLSQFLGHTVFGVVAALIVTRLGDPGLFNGKIPVTIKNNQADQQEIVQPQENVSRKGIVRRLAQAAAGH